MEADQQRIEAARRLLGEAPGEAIDRLAALGARLLGASYAQVSLFADVQVPLTPPTPRRPPADALVEATFYGQEPPKQAGIGAYLGVRIEAAGHCVGVLCVYDEEEATWTEHDRDVLSELAAAVAAELERGSLAAELEDSAARLSLGFAAADIGSFDWDLRTDALQFDERLMELFGYTPATFTGHIDSFVARLHPEDRARTQAAIAKAVDRLGDYEADYRVVHEDGTVRWVAARGRVIGNDGTPVRMLGAAYDTTAVHSAAERLGRVLETMSTAFLTLDLNWTFTYLNGAAERIFGRSRGELVGRCVWDVYPELEGTETAVAYRRAITTGEPQSFEQYHPPLDIWFDVRATPGEDGLSVYFHDITGRVRAEQDAARLAGEREDALAASGAATGRLQILSAASARLAGTLEVDELLTILSDVVVNGFGAAVVVALRDRIVRDLAGKPTMPDGGKAFRIAHTVNVDPALHGATIPATALAAGAVQQRPARELDERLGDRLSLTLPLISRGRMLGAIVVLDPVTGALDRRVLTELAARSGVALDNAMLYGAERRLALTLQRSLLPADLPELPGIELATRYLPGTGGRDVGGDFYIAHPLEDGRVLLVIGDVMGHGAQAAARMGQLRAVLAAYAYDGDPPDRVLAHLSVRAPALLDLPMATVLAAVYDPQDRRLTFSLAGHLPPLIAPRDSAPYFADARPGPPLGTETGEYARHTLTLPPGATLVFYTDGLIEERELAIDAGMERLRQALDGVDLDPDGVADHVLRALDREQGGEDDIALLVMRA
ncbi:SpoIIE family protein phosphatase [Solirubrobacter sp. CPCC 204708]|uniref:SpoIIE family protein phosphatase n=1 Tax=Solirubrobacter deserti TaxID=2282478 RepID=A0ABT4RR23_9ACTN|nr:SpoIIE family protein phosphatase [Solirubrobacter deserti]MBE2320090.1 SpoIIE family protein phosphatase [Solirubrobacter deserti]MDA0140971.1 SpoIIE family protein phosphatase [Solirubrobacter deserti]